MADRPKPPPSREHQVRVIGALVLAALLLIFAIQNYSTRARVEFLFFHRDSRVIYVIIVSAVAGAIAGWLVRRRRRRERREERRDS